MGFAKSVIIHYNSLISHNTRQQRAKIKNFSAGKYIIGLALLNEAVHGLRLGQHKWEIKFLSVQIYRIGLPL